MSVTVKILNKSTNPLPVYKTPGSAGLDIYSNEEIIVAPNNGRVLVKTGLFLAIPAGYEIQVRPRSGIAINNGVTVLNTPGTIDSDYRDEVGIIIINHSHEPFKISKGDRIAQFVLAKVEQVEWNQVTTHYELGNTERDGGFGSTGV